MTVTTTAIRPSPEAGVALLRRYFLNREDVLATQMTWGKPHPQQPGEKLDAFLTAHIQGPAAPRVHIGYKDKRGGTHAESGHFRCGAYAPAPDGTTKWLCIDLDGGKGHAHALVDPRAAAIATKRAFEAAGLPAYLERSGGGHGWHVWVFFAEPVTARQARAIGHAMVPKDAPLTSGEMALPVSGRGIEIFPKQNTVSKGKVGNLVYLPWWWNAPDGAAIFYRVHEDGRIEPYLPETFESASTETVEKIVATLSVEAPRPTSVKGHDRWSAWRRAALAALSLDSVYGDWLTGQAKGAGWLECRDPDSGSGDEHPSAGVADGTGDAERGTFHSFISGRTMSVFDFLVERGQAADFDAAKALVAERSGVELPRGPAGGWVRSADLDEMRRQQDARYALVPGQHAAAGPLGCEIGNHIFVDDVLGRLPEGTLYRMDFVVGELAGKAGNRRFVPVGEQQMRAIVDRHVKLAQWRMTDEGPERRFLSCSRDLAGLLLAGAGTSNKIPELQLLVHNPTYLSDLTLAAPGWNAAEGVYYDEPPELEGLTAQVEGALEVLYDLVVDFPLRDEASRQNVFGAMLTVILRQAIAGRLPFLGHFAPLERSGKGKLADTALGEAVLGHALAPMQVGRTEEEREKRITALLLQGETVVHLDNLPVGEIVDSAALASLATSYPFWRGRMLGVSRVPQLRNNLLVVLSGNNTKTTGEIAKRTVPVFLQPATDHPEDRTDFVHPDAEGYARSRRPVVLAALLGLVESWKAAGCPPAPHRRTIGGFERWAAMVGGVLAHAGLTEWLGNYRAWVGGADDWTNEAETLVEHWAKVHGTTPIQARDVLEMIRELGIYTAVTSRPSEAAQWSALGKRVLAPLVGRPVRRWSVEVEGRGGSKRYYLQPLGTPEEETGRRTAGGAKGSPPCHQSEGTGTSASSGTPAGASSAPSSTPSTSSEPLQDAHSEGSEGSEGFQPDLTRREPCWPEDVVRVSLAAAQDPSNPSDPSESTARGCEGRPGKRRRAGDPDRRVSLDLRDIPDIPDIPQIVSSPRTPATAPDEDAAAEAELDAMYAAFGTGGA